MNNLESENVIVAIGVLSILADGGTAETTLPSSPGVAKTARRNLPPDAAIEKSPRKRCRDELY